MITDPKKYRRLFSVGCSFTEYHYPTWANVLSESMPDAEFYNLGLSGTSNPFIAHRLVEGNQKFKFCHTDLVVVMWTTTCRETHYVRGNWFHPGNIFSQSVYSSEFVEKFADPDGYLIRDLATIELATRYASTLSCDYVGLLSTPLDFMYAFSPQQRTQTHYQILDTYSDLLSGFPRSMLELELNSEWQSSCEYSQGDLGPTRPDYHPSPTQYCNYLIRLGFPITPDAIDYAARCTQLLSGVKHRDDFVSLFPYCHNYRAPGIW